MNAPTPQRLLRSALLLCLLVGISAAASAQQRQRRVWTNEDVGSPAPSQPAPEPAAETPAASVPDAKNAPATRATSPSAPYSELGPQERIARLTAMQHALEQAREVYADKEAKETDDTLKARWNGLSMCLLSVMRENQNILEDLQGEPPQEQLQPVEPQ